MVRFTPTSLLTGLLALISLSTAHHIQLRAHSSECFHELLHHDDLMTVTFVVGDREFSGSTNLEIDFHIRNPSGTLIHSTSSTTHGDHSFTAPSDGKYTYCFDNTGWSTSSKEVSFNVHGVVYVPEDSIAQEPIDREVKRLSQLLEEVKDEQGYIILRERMHRNTAESTNARVKWWSIFQIGVLVGEGVFQVWWLKRFFEVKRVV